MSAHRYNNMNALILKVTSNHLYDNAMRFAFKRSIGSYGCQQDTMRRLMYMTNVQGRFNRPTAIHVTRAFATSMKEKEIGKMIPPIKGDYGAGGRIEGKSFTSTERTNERYVEVPIKEEKKYDWESIGIFSGICEL